MLKVPYFNQNDRTFAASIPLLNKKFRFRNPFYRLRPTQYCEWYKLCDREWPYFGVLLWTDS